MPRIVVVGSYNTDFVINLPELPKPGETIRGSDFVTGPGGKGSNQAVAAARLGAQVSFVVCIGRDTFGDMAEALWRAEGIDTRYVQRHESAATGAALIFVDAAGENMIAVASGANWEMRPEHLDIAEDAFRGADALLMPLEVPLEAVDYALTLAKKYGLRTVLNPAPARPLSAELLAKVDVLTPNQIEAEMMSGQQGDPAVQARALMGGAGQALVMTLGRRGAFWQQGDQSGIVPAFPVEAIDTVGAGDAFNGGLTVALSEGLDLNAALRFANAAAAIACTRPGAANSLPTRSEVDAFLRERG